MKVIIIMTIINFLNFLNFLNVQDFQNFKNRTLESKYDDTRKFYMALNEFKNHKATTDETGKCKNRVINNAVALQNNYFDSYKKKLSNLNETERYAPYQFKIADWLKSKSDFNEAKRLIDDIKIHMNKFEVNKEDKKVFDNLNKLIFGI